METIKQARDGQGGASRARTVIVQLQDGLVESFGVYDSQERREQHRAAIRKARTIPEMKTVLPKNPAEIPVRIITSTG